MTEEQIESLAEAISDITEWAGMGSLSDAAFRHVKDAIRAAKDYDRLYWLARNRAQGAGAGMTDEEIWAIWCEGRRADFQGVSDGAGECAEAIRAR